jgi:hypothetical protein
MARNFIQAAPGESVADAVRKQKDAILYSDGSDVPLTGQYYDLMRATQQVRTAAPTAFTNAGIRGIRNQYGGVKSYAAAGYNYPSGQMVIGAGLSAVPYPSLETPSAARKRQMATLMGLSGIDESRIQATKDCISLLDPSTYKLDTKAGRIAAIKATFQFVFGRQPNDREIEYYGAMYWCASVNPSDSATIVGVMKAIKRYNISTTPSANSFPAFNGKRQGADSFNDSFRIRSSLLDLIPGVNIAGVGKVVRWAYEQYKTDTPATGGGDTGGGDTGGGGGSGDGSGGSSDGTDSGLSQGAIIGIVAGVAALGLVAYLATRP